MYGEYDRISSKGETIAILKNINSKSATENHKCEFSAAQKGRYF